MTKKAKQIAIIILGLIVLPLTTRAQDNHQSFINSVNRGDVDTVSEFLDQGFDVNARIRKNRTALIQAANDGYTDLVKTLLDRGADINAQDDIDMTALMHSVKNSHIEVVKLLLSKGADVNLSSEGGLVAFHWVGMTGNIEIAKLFLERGVDINTQSKNNGTTALTMAAIFGRPNIVPFLLNNGADKTLTNSKGETALMIAEEREHSGIVRVMGTERENYAIIHLLKYDEFPSDDAMYNYYSRSDPLKIAAEDKLRSAALKGTYLSVWKLLDEGVNVNAQDEKGRTALMLAAANGWTKIVNFLIDRGADINIAEESGWTALIYASSHGRTKTIKTLMKNGADINFQTEQGATALSIASQKGRVNIVKLLLKNGADVNLQDNNGLTAMMIASDPKTKKILKKAGGEEYFGKNFKKRLEKKIKQNKSSPLFINDGFRG